MHHENIVALLDCQVKPFSPSFLFCLPTRFKDVPGVFHDTMGVARDQPRSTTLFARVSFLFNFKGIFQNPHPPRLNVIWEHRASLETTYTWERNETPLTPMVCCR